MFNPDVKFSNNLCCFCLYDHSYIFSKLLNITFKILPLVHFKMQMQSNVRLFYAVILLKLVCVIRILISA